MLLHLYCLLHLCNIYLFMLFHEAWKDMYNHVVHEWTILYIEMSDFLFVITKIPDIQTP